MRVLTARPRVLPLLALTGLLLPVAAHALPLADAGVARRPDLVVDATLRQLPSSPVILLVLSLIAGGTALVLSARASWVLRSQTVRQARDLEALQARERRLRLAVQDSDNGLLHLEAIRDGAGRVIDFVVTDANVRAAALFRRPLDDVFGLRTSTLASVGHDTPLFHTLVETLRTGAIYRAEVRAHPRHVATSWLLVRAVRVEDGLALTLTDIRDRKRESQRLRRASLTDPLTGLVNRRGFVEHAAQQLAQARAAGTESLLFYLDCDAFKAINDTCGHAIGDRALVEIGRALRASVRDSDLVARLGGDEFTILALETTGDCADTIRARIQARLDALNRSQVLPMPVGVSVGHVHVPASETRSLSTLLHAADEELAHRKRARRAARSAMATIARSSRSPAPRAVVARAATAGQLTGVPSLA
jgi:diguanylate cyclase (GGDEF)-like protein